MIHEDLPSRSRNVVIGKSSFNLRASFQLVKVFVHVRTRTTLSAVIKELRVT